MHFNGSCLPLTLCAFVCCNQPVATTPGRPPAREASAEKPQIQQELLKQLEANNPHQFDMGEQAPVAAAEPQRPPLEPTKRAEKRASGIATEVLVTGRGKRSPKDHDKVSVRFALWAKSGELLEAPGAAPQYIEVAGMPGWVEGLKLMVEGEKRRIWIPAKLATVPNTKSETMGDVIVDLELLQILTP